MGIRGICLAQQGMVDRSHRACAAGGNVVYLRVRWRSTVYLYNLLIQWQMPFLVNPVAWRLLEC